MLSKISVIVTKKEKYYQMMRKYCTKIKEIKNNFFLIPNTSLTI